ncbi:hypothetical protein [Neobacillus sp. Marseille-QA0830]
MLIDFLFELRNWLLAEPIDETLEFERLESKHTRVHHDEDIYERIRVH